jgi:hypothetical protein
MHDGMGNFILNVLCCKGVRQGCGLGTPILCITVRLVYDALKVILGLEGFLLSYADVVYMGGKPWNVALTLKAASGLHAMIGLSLGWGPRKT